MPTRHGMWSGSKMVHHRHSQPPASLAISLMGDFLSRPVLPSACRKSASPPNRPLCHGGSPSNRLRRAARDPQPCARPARGACPCAPEAEQSGAAGTSHPHVRGGSGPCSVRRPDRSPPAHPVVGPEAHLGARHRRHHRRPDGRDSAHPAGDELRDGAWNLTDPNPNSNPDPDH